MLTLKNHQNFFFDKFSTIVLSNPSLSVHKFSYSWIIDYESRTFYSIQFHENGRKRDLKMLCFFHIRFWNVQFFFFILCFSRSDWNVFFLCCFWSISSVHWRILYTARSRKRFRWFDDDARVCEFDWASKQIHSFNLFFLRKSWNSIFALNHSWIFCMNFVWGNHQ